MAKTYWDKLKDIRWQKRRLEILALANFLCEWCAEEGKTLHVHHKLYRKGADPWEYKDSELIALCEDCHKDEHEWRDRIKEGLAKLDLSQLETVSGYISAMIASSAVFDESPQSETLQIHVLSYDHAAGIADGLGVPRKHLSVEKIIAMRPLTGNDIFCLQVHGLDEAAGRKAVSV